MSSFWLEGTVVVVSLFLTLSVGLFFSRDGKKSLQEYMLGSRKMSVLPISLSIGATFLTGSSMVSTSQEVYLYGLEVCIAPLLYGLYGIACAYVYLPVSYSIKSASSFQFFDRRFNAHIRKLASLIYAFETIHHTAMALYIPAVSISQATGLSTFPTACVLSLLCLIYTASGGLKAVAWADSVQAVIFFLCAIILLAVGIYQVGGPAEIWQRAEEGSRLGLFNFNPSPYIRYSFWNMAIGSITLMTNIYLSPSYHQRVAAMPTFKQARQVVIWSSLFTALFLSLTYTTGLTVFAYFEGCDPVLAKKDIRGYSTILPYFMNQIAEHVPGIEGVFLSGVIAAGLSTITSSWNTVACTFYEDIVTPCLKNKPNKKNSFRILIGIAIVVCVISTAFVLIIETMSSILEATLTMKSFTTSLYFVLYHGGMFLPWANAKGILAGCLASGGLTSYIVIGAQTAKRKKLMKDVPKFLTTAKCLVNGTTTMEALNRTISMGSTSNISVNEVVGDVPRIFRLSMMMYMVPGAVLGLLVTYVVSMMTGPQDINTVDRDMIAPQMRWVLPKKNENLRRHSEELRSLRDNPEDSKPEKV